MKNVSISLTDHHAAQIELEIASGGYASVSEVIRRRCASSSTARDRPEPGSDRARHRRLPRRRGDGRRAVLADDAGARPGSGRDPRGERSGRRGRCFADGFMARPPRRCAAARGRFGASDLDPEVADWLQAQRQGGI